MTTQQEALWAGEFGRDYTKRNADPRVGSIQANAMLFDKIMRHTFGVKQVLEWGCGAGLNLAALRKHQPWLQLAGADVNKEAIAQAQKRLPEPKHTIINASILEGTEALGNHGVLPADLVLSKGLLIHIHPNDLERAYETLYQSTRRYILVCEYFSQDPVSIPYRGQPEALWKRDFAGDLLDAYDDLQVVSYGFAWRRDPDPQDDLNWFLLEKTGPTYTPAIAGGG